jgi:hypothetical protein
MIIYFNLSSLIYYDSSLVKLETLSIGPATCSNKNIVGLESLFLVGINVFNVNLATIGTTSASINFSLESEFDSLFFKNLLEITRYF